MILNVSNLEAVRDRLRWRTIGPVVEWLLLAMFSGMLFFQTVPAAWRSLNTDFPNYYLTATLALEGVDTSRTYDWVWLARQKDHHSIDRAVIGMVPITPFSTLVVAPLTGFAPLTAKRIWLVLQLGLLLPLALALRDLTAQPMRRIALLLTACLPLHRNLLYGQMYILLLALIVFALVAQRRGHGGLCGTLVGIAAALKLFPVVFALYFLRRKQWRELFSLLLALGLAVAVSVGIFGWEMHRTYLLQVLPWTLRGDALPPFALGSSSLSTLLHCLFLYEPQWNAHPWHFAPRLYAVLQAVLPMLILAPALLLVDTEDRGPERIALEWSAVLVATLTISTIPASYNFTLMVLPMAVLCGYLLPRRWLATVFLGALYAGICYPDGWYVGSADGLRAALQVPRLYLLLFLLVFLYCTIAGVNIRGLLRRRETMVLASALTLLTCCGVVTGLRHQRGLYEEFAFRVPDATGSYLSALPQAFGGKIVRVAMQPDGYRLVDGAPPEGGPEAWADGARGVDQLAFSANENGVWVEEAGSYSRIVPWRSADGQRIDDAESPVLSSDGTYLSYIRVARGRGQLFLRSLKGKTAGEERTLTPLSLNVERAASLPGGGWIVAATSAKLSGPHLYRLHPDAEPELLALGEARDPAVSPDGRWLAYSLMASGNWHLALLDMQTQQQRLLVQAECNTMQPAWESDSRTLLYANDCGRALWFTAISRRVIP